MASWKVTITGKGLRRAAVDKLVEKMKSEFGEGATVQVQDATPPESRAERFSAATGLVGEARSEAETLRDELQEWKDNIPENMQSGSKADELDEAISSLEEFISGAEDLEGFDVSFPGMR